MVDKLDDRDKLIVILTVGLVALVSWWVWFAPVHSEEIYGDYTHWGPHPCSGICSDYEAQDPIVYGCCVYYVDSYPLKGGHAYYNVFGVEVYREWEWIS